MKILLWREMMKSKFDVSKAEEKIRSGAKIDLD